MGDPIDETSARGRCVCEGVSYEVRGQLRDVVNCHCWRCRRWSGHHVAVTGAATSAIHFDRHDTLAWYELSDGAAYGFCNRCGASVAWRHADRPGWMSLCAGLLDPPTGLTTTMAIHTSSASDYHRLDPDMETWPHEVL
jgi:hypothetical protein